MSHLYPYIFNEMLQDIHRPTIFDQHFGINIPTSDVISLPMRLGYLRPWHRHQHSQHRDSGMSQLVNDKDGFKVNLDVQQFKPDELNVKIVDDYVVVEGKHEERSDEHGFISRQFTRRYKLPMDIDAKALESKLSSDGVLQLHAPKLALTDSSVRSIPITQTNQPALQQQQQQQHPVAQSQAVEEDKKEKPDK